MDDNVMYLKIVDILLDIVPDSDALNRATEALLAAFQVELDDLEATLGTVTALARTFEAERNEARALLRAHGIEAVQA